MLDLHSVCAVTNEVRLRLDTELGEQVRAQVCQDISDRANGNLEKEQLLSELRNHIAIVRYMTGSTKIHLQPIKHCFLLLSLPAQVAFAC